ncbi:hypothetical protein FRB94_012556 [Tulasnella sp. JGI-2019a]|nr:hypothetical protein FRB94_012556 [Tulasnella sp. JGI-2019a]KAG9003155.1 hypothetical protein FRB93_011235 [Tulasnella sp. JGI-2019a]
MLNHLGAESYFIVDQQDMNEGVILALARQLASWGDKRLRAEIASAVDKDRDITQRAMEVQFRELIQAPLETLADDLDCLPLVLLLDGLDEFNNDSACRFLYLIGQSLTRLPPAVKFIVTSRPEPHLLNLYDRDPMEARLMIRSLDSEDAGEVQNDIRAYFKQKLPQMAVTGARMIADPNFRDPGNQLNAILSIAPDPNRVYGHNIDLYALYSKILDRPCPSTSHDQLLISFRNILRVLCVVESPIHIHTLASLLHLDHPSSENVTDYIRTSVLGYLRAVLIVPDVDEEYPSRDATPIRLIHKSFEDYLNDGPRCGTRFLVNRAEQHRRMAIQCMRHMDDLKKPNICDLDPTMLNSEIFGYDADSNDRSDDLNSHGANNDNKGDDTREESNKSVRSDDPNERNENITDRDSGTFDTKGIVRQHISSGLQYACENWATHV